METMEKKLYKVLNGDKSCNGGAYVYDLPKLKKDGTWKPGKWTKKMKKADLKMCCVGYHLTTNPANWLNNTSTVVYRAEARGVVRYRGDKCVCGQVRLLKPHETNTGLNNTGLYNGGNNNTGLYNSGDRNSGNSNSGDWNSGYSNSGYSNSGDRNSGGSNSGDWNSGYSNSGDSNSGDRNSGYSNSGDRNSGDRNSGGRNSGNRNSGDWNSGGRNSGYSNSGDRNSGDNNSGGRNSGNRNSGDWNSGDRNSGDNNSGGSNSGDRNSGNSNSGGSNSGGSNSGGRNSGDWNSGDWNSGQYHTGYFNTDKEPLFLMFNKSCKIKRDKIKFPYYFKNIVLTEWINYTDEEKKSDNKKALIRGYLKTYTYKEAWAVAFKEASKIDIELTIKLPNFDYKIFEEITGITEKDIKEVLKGE